MSLSECLPANGPLQPRGSMVALFLAVTLAFSAGAVSEPTSSPIPDTVGVGTRGAEEAAPTALPKTGGQVWLGSDGKPLPFTSEEEILEFLRTANVVSLKDIGEGITKPKKVLLEKDGIQMHAIFRDVDQEKAMVRFATGKSETGFRDSYIFEPAAYELSRLLGLGSVPPVVTRRIRAKSGSLQIWIEKAMTENTRREKELKPPDVREWTRQIYIQRIFDALVFNTDRNLGNTLIDSNWKMWLIDHTRAFRTQPELRHQEMLLSCDRALWNKLRTLDEATVKERLKEFLRDHEIGAVLERRKMLLQHFQQLIEERGEENVLYPSE